MAKHQCSGGTAKGPEKNHLMRIFKDQWSDATDPTRYRCRQIVTPYSEGSHAVRYLGVLVWSHVELPRRIMALWQPLAAQPPSTSQPPSVPASPVLASLPASQPNASPPVQANLADVSYGSRGQSRHVSC